jgi:hypothetical protein
MRNRGVRLRCTEVSEELNVSFFRIGANKFIYLQDISEYGMANTVSGRGDSSYFISILKIIAVDS